MLAANVVLAKRVDALCDEINTGPSFTSMREKVRWLNTRQRQMSSLLPYLTRK